MELNEKIGIPLFILFLVCLVANILKGGSLTLFILQGLFGITSLIFLSWWGMTTFNDKYYK